MTPKSSHYHQYIRFRPSCGILSPSSCKVIDRVISERAGRFIVKTGNDSGGHSERKSHSIAGHAGEGKDRHLHNPIQDRLIPLEPLDLTKVKSIDDLVRAMSKTAFTGRQLGEAADVLEAMARDEDRFVVMTLLGCDDRGQAGPGGDGVD